MAAAWLDVRPATRMVPGQGWDVILHPPRMTVVGCDSWTTMRALMAWGGPPCHVGGRWLHGGGLPAFAGGAKELMDGRDVTPATSKPLEGVGVRPSDAPVSHRGWMGWDSLPSPGGQKEW